MEIFLGYPNMGRPVSFAAIAHAPPEMRPRVPMANNSAEPLIGEPQRSTAGNGASSGLPDAGGGVAAGGLRVTEAKAGSSSAGGWLLSGGSTDAEVETGSFSAGAESSFPSSNPETEPLPEPLRPAANMWVYNLGLACCTIEYTASTLNDKAWEQISSAPTDRRLQDAHLLIISGTITDKMASSIQATYAQMPAPKYVLSFGSCTNTGGPYWDSYSVTKGAAQIVPVDVYIPGCPPRPEALLQGLQVLQEQLSKAEMT